MNVISDEKNKAQLVLDKCKDNERKRKLVPVLICRTIKVMMPANYTKEQLDEKRKKYIKQK